MSFSCLLQISCDKKSLYTIQSRTRGQCCSDSVHGLFLNSTFLLAFPVLNMQNNSQGDYL